MVSTVWERLSVFSVNISGPVLVLGLLGGLVITTAATALFVIYNQIKNFGGRR